MKFRITYYPGLTEIAEAVKPMRKIAALTQVRDHAQDIASGSKIYIQRIRPPKARHLS